MEGLAVQLVDRFNTEETGREGGRGNQVPDMWVLRKATHESLLPKQQLLGGKRFEALPQWNEAHLERSRMSTC